MDKAPIDIHVQFFVYTHRFDSFRQITGAQLLDHMVKDIFTFVRNIQIVFQRGCTGCSSYCIGSQLRKALENALEAVGVNLTVIYFPFKSVREAGKRLVKTVKEKS